MMVFSVMIFVLGGFFAVLVSSAPDNKGKEFIIAFMDNYLERFPLELFITTSSTQSVFVNVTSPKWQTPFINETFTITSGNVQQLNLDLQMRLEGSEFSSKAILIQASNEIVLYGVNKQAYSNDVFLGLPTDVLGTEYYAVTYYPPYRKAQILVVGIEDDTLLEIFLTANTSLNDTHFLKGEILSQQMNRYDTLQLQSDGDFTGTYIKSSKPVNFFSGNRKTNTGLGWSQDHLVENLPPVETWGKTFATVPIPERTIGDLFKIVACNRTDIAFRCVKNNTYSNFTVTLEKAGEFHQRVIDSGTYCSIKSTEAILVVQIVLSQVSWDEPSDPSMILVLAVEQYAADYTLASPEYSQGTYDNFFMFIANKAEIAGLRIDGKPFPNNTFYQEIPGTKLIGGYINITNGFHKVAHISPISVFCGFLYGRAHYETYGFPVGMRRARINTVCVPTTAVEADGIDNDCDGLIDEELCAPGQGVPDDDEDGKINEDCAKPYKADGKWSQWSNWSDCTATCEAGTQERFRACTDPPPQSGGQNCSGPEYESQQCNTHNCPIHGNWTEWEEWTNCSKPCDGGIQVQRRFCTNPTPKYGGYFCTGNPNNTRPCNVHRCDGLCDCTRFRRLSDHVKCGGPRNIPWKQQQEEIEQYLAEIKKDLLIDRKKTNRYMRTVTSTSDDRPTSSAIGYAVVSLFIFIGVGFTIVDIRVFRVHFKRASSNIKSLCKPLKRKNVYMNENDK